MNTGKHPVTIAKMFLSRFKNKPVIIAEAGVNHNGDVRLAEKLVEAAATAGADAIKFQTFKAFECASRFAPAADYQKNNGITDQFELLKALELPFAAFAHLKQYTENLGLTFLSTPDGQLSLEYLLQLKVGAIKIASGELTNHPFLKTIGQCRLPVILSTGMGTLGKIQSALDILTLAGAPELILLHCTTEYPAPASDINLRAILTMQQAFNLPVGFSDHTEGSEAAIAATAMGAVLIEKHLTLDRDMAGPDHSASMNPQEFAAMVSSIRRVNEMLGDGIKKPAPCELANMALVNRSLVAAANLSAGEVLTLDNIAIKRPADGIGPEMLEQALNRRVLVDITADEPLQWAQLGEVCIIEP